MLTELLVQRDAVTLRSAQQHVHAPYVLRQTITDLQAPWIRKVTIQGVKQAVLQDAVMKTFGADTDVEWSPEVA